MHPPAEKSFVFPSQVFLDLGSIIDEMTWNDYLGKLLPKSVMVNIYLNIMPTWSEKKRFVYISAVLAVQPLDKLDGHVLQMGGDLTMLLCTAKRQLGTAV